MLTAPEVADLLRTTRQGMYHWLQKGIIPAYKVGSTWVIPRDELKETLRKGSNLAALVNDEESNEG